MPTIIAINQDPDAPPRLRAKHVVMAEPENPHDKTWYRVKIVNLLKGIVNERTMLSYDDVLLATVLDIRSQLQD